MRRTTVAHYKLDCSLMSKLCAIFWIMVDWTIKASTPSLEHGQAGIPRRGEDQAANETLSHARFAPQPSATTTVTAIRFLCPASPRMRQQGYNISLFRIIR